MSSWNELHRFARAHTGELTLSVYVAASPPDPTERQSWMVLLRQHVNALRDQLGDAHATERDIFEVSVERLFEQLPAQRTMPRGQSWAFFRGAGGDELILALPPGVETAVHWGIGARVVPFLRVAEPEEALVVQVDKQEARLTHFKDGNFEAPVVLDAATFDELGTPDEAKRTRLQATENLHGNTLKRIATMAGNSMPILIGGASESAMHVLTSLPTALADRAIIMDELRMDAPSPELSRMRVAMHTLRARDQHERIELLREAAYGSGKASLGFETTQAAADRGAIAELIFSDTAWQKHPERIEALVRDAIAEGANVEWAEPATEHDLNGPIEGVAALLRFSLASAP